MSERHSIEPVEPMPLLVTKPGDGKIVDEMILCEKIFWSRTQVQRDWDYRNPEEKRTNKQRDKHSQTTPWGKWCREHNKHKRNK